MSSHYCSLRRLRRAARRPGPGLLGARGTGQVGCDRTRVGGGWARDVGASSTSWAFFKAVFFECDYSGCLLGDPKYIH